VKHLMWLILAIFAFMLGPAVADSEGDENGIKHRVATLEYEVEQILDWIASSGDQNSSAFQVRDSEDKQVGELLGMASPWNWQLAMVALDIEEQHAMVRLSRSEIWWDELVYFADTECQGPAYLPMGRVGMSWFDPPVVISVLPGIPESRSPYVPIELPPISVEQIVKVGLPEGCGDPPGELPMGEFVAVAPIMQGDAPVDLHREFPPPYQLSD
jgi:hypothetical protein